MGITVYPPQVKTYNIQYFPASSTFTLPSTGINQFDCLLVAGGGGGGRVNNVNQMGQGGLTSMVYFQNTYCTNGSVLTITVGAGGAGSTTLATGGSNGSATSISGLTGNGVSNTLTTGIGQGGSGTYAVSTGYSYPNLGSWNGGVLSNNTNNNFANNLYGSGMASYAGAAGTNQNYINTSYNLWNGETDYYISGAGPVKFTTGGNGAAAPLLGSYLHSATGGTGTAGTSAGGACNANTFFAGSGGSGGNSNQGWATGSPTYGGGGGGGGQSATGGTLAGNGGNASALSGGGGGGGGGNTVTAANSGNGGNGGSGFAIIGWWG